jgi:hypothetical protein
MTGPLGSGPERPAVRWGRVRKDGLSDTPGCQAQAGASVTGTVTPGSAVWKSSTGVGPSHE